MIIVPQRSRKRLFKRILVWSGITALVVGLALGAWFGGRFALEKWERRQSRELVKAAAANLEEGAPKAALMALETAVRLDPANAGALRMLAALQQAGAGGAEALGTMQALAKTGRMTSGDLLAYFSLALNEGEFELARRLADSASKGGGPAMRHRLLARVAVRADNPELAERELREAVAVDGTGRSRLELARVLLSQELAPATRLEVLEMLRGVSIRPDSKGAEALVLGLSNNLVPLVEVDGWIAALRKHPAATTRQRFTADRAEARIHPGRKSEIARSAALRLAARPLAERAEAMGWALSLGEPGAAASLVRPAEALGHPNLFAAWIDAKVRMGAWRKSVEVWKENGDLPPGWLVGLFESRALLAEGDSRGSREAVERALEEARERPEDFRRAAAFLAAAGSGEEFEKALQEALAENPADHGEVFRDVLSAVWVRREAAPALRVFELATAGAKGPLDPILQNEMDHLALLAGWSVDVESLAARSKAEPSHFPFRATYALGLLREGRAHEAMQVLEDCKPDVRVDFLPARLKMVVASALAAVGERDMARRLAGSIPQGEIWPREAALFSELLAKPPAKRVPRIRIERDGNGKAIPFADPAKEATRRAIEEAFQSLEIVIDAPPDPTQRAIQEVQREWAESNEEQTTP